MADSKITALTALTAADPANDMIPIVDVSDTPPASGNTKRISINNILACSPSATLASATISGDLTVDTSTLKVDSANNRVGIGTASPAETLHVSGGNIRMSINQFLYLYYGSATNYASLGADNSGNVQVFTGLTSPANRFQIANDGVCTWSNVGGVAGTAMTLNSTGLGVGVTPASGDGSGAFKAAGTGSLTANSRVGLDVRELVSGNSAGIILGAMTTENTAVIGSRTASGNIAFQTYNGSSWGERMRIDYLGNVGIGVQPSAWGGSYKALQIGQSASVSGFSSELAVFGSNCYFDTTDSRWERITSGFTSQYYQTNGTHVWRIGGTAGANTDCSFTQAMTLDASGRLLVNTASVIGGSGDTLQIAGKTTAGTDYCSMYTGTSTTVYGARYYHTSAVVGSITFTASGTAYNIASDYRLKEAVAPLTGGLARVSALKPSIYKWKVNGSDGEGFIAHELAEVIPAAVTGQKDAVNEDGSIQPQQVDLSKVVPVLVAAIQELTARVQTLETR